MFGVAEIAIVGSILTFTVVVAVWEAAEVGAPFNSNAGTAKRLAANVALIIFTSLFNYFSLTSIMIPICDKGSPNLVTASARAFVSSFVSSVYNL